MANEEQLSILSQGVKVWNKWREMNNGVDGNPDEANQNVLYPIDPRLLGTNLGRVNLRKADLRSTDLTGANFCGADLSNADFSGANLSKADLTYAHLVGANFRGANLSNAQLIGSDLSDTELVGGDLSEAELGGANLERSSVDKTKFRFARLFATKFIDIDLREVIGLNETIHIGPSPVATSTMAISKGKIPEAFLRGCGLSDWEIEVAKLYNPEISNGERNQILYKIYDLQASQAIQISPLFISYSYDDREFVNKIDKCLTEKGVRFWRDIHDLKAGRIEKQIDQAISQDRTVLLVLSEHSFKSDWVEHEVRKAREIAKNAGRDTLCPLALDDSWKESPWPARVMEQIMEYNILDFSEWKDDSKFEDMFRRLIDGLELFYKG